MDPSSSRTNDDVPDPRSDESGIPGSYKFGHSCFRDGKRRIDFVLAFYDHGITERDRKRGEFLAGLIDAGLEVEKEQSLGRRHNLFFIKLHLPNKVLLHNAEILNVKLVYKEEYEEEKDTFFSRLMKIIQPESKKPTRIYRSSFQGDTSETLIKEIQPKFTNLDRIRIVWDILSRTKFGPGSREFGIQRLLNANIYVAAYPLHEGTYIEDNVDGERTARRKLFVEWADLMSTFYKMQPIHLVKEYFGEEVALYFDWLGHYTKMLVIASVLGILVFLYGLISLRSEDMIPSKEICVSNLTLCPSCWNTTECKFIPLRDSCVYSQLSYLFDNPSTVVFAAAMSFWGTVFIELWKREQSVLSLRWDLRVEYEDPRPDFEMKTKKERFNPITGKSEPYIPFHEKIIRYSLTTTVIVLLSAAAVSVFYGLLVYRVEVRIAMEKSPSEFVRSHKSIFVTTTSALMNLVVMMIFEYIFTYIAHILTDLENPRTQSEYDDSYTFKVFVFEFINFYSGLIYIAFFKGSFYTYPGDQVLWDTNYGLSADVCDPTGCFSEVFIQLSIVMVGKQLFSNILEFAQPQLVILWNRLRFGHFNTEILPAWEKDFALVEFTSTSLFGEQLEMVVQYGFVTLFVAAFPLAPFFALVNNIIEIRVDAYKLLVSKRRALPRKVRGLGAWDGIIQGITYLAVAFNAFVIAFTSDFAPRLIYRIKNDWHLAGYVNWTLSAFDTKDYGQGNLQYDTCRYKAFREPPSSSNRYAHSYDHWLVLATRFIFVVLFEHVILSLAGVLAYAIPDVPLSVKQQMEAERAEALETRKKLATLRRQRKESANS
ncbi:anoctamin-4-like [Periplaneta americana]|uniref:anoctamin-4-like n=1 Tax=Periplaneta americana TaxID=6978 RepID=UPI0037E83629